MRARGRKTRADTTHWPSASPVRSSFAAGLPMNSARHPGCMREQLTGDGSAGVMEGEGGRQRAAAAAHPVLPAPCCFPAEFSPGGRESPDWPEGRPGQPRAGGRRRRRRRLHSLHRQLEPSGQGACLQNGQPDHFLRGGYPGGVGVVWGLPRRAGTPRGSGAG